MARTWTSVESPVSTTLYDVSFAARRAYAVGEDGRVCVRDADGDWHLVLDGGVAGDSTPLRAVDATNDGGHVWFCGESGLLAGYDADADALEPFANPAGVEDDFLALTVAGDAGDERVFAATDDGDVVVGGPGDPWTRVDVSDDALVGVTPRSPRVCVAATTTRVHRTRDGGASWTASRPLGDPRFTALTDGRGRLWAGGRDGHVHRYDRGCGVWTATRVAEADVTAVASVPTAVLGVGEEGVAVRHEERGWSTLATGTAADLRGVTIGPRVVAVGDAGAIVETPRETLV